MKIALQAVFAIAWLPIVWLLASATLGKALAVFLPFEWLIHALVASISLLLIFLALRYLSLLAEKVFGSD